MSTEKNTTAKRRRLSREQRRTELLLGAIQTAADIGLGNLVHAEIAKNCNVSIATVFSYFPDSETLIRSTIDEVHRFYREQCDEYLDNNNGTYEDLVAFGAAFTGSVDSHPQYAAVFLQWAASVGNTFGMWDLFVQHMQYVEEKVSECLQADRARSGAIATAYADTLSQLLVGSAFTILRKKFSGAGEEEIQKFLDQSTEIYTMLVEAGDSPKE